MKLLLVDDEEYVIESNQKKPRSYRDRGERGVHCVFRTAGEKHHGEWWTLIS